MKWLIIPVFWFLYWGICFLCTGTDKKNLAGLRLYPDAVQSIVCGIPLFAIIAALSAGVVALI